MKKAVLIMAGGRGERSWPKGRKKLPITEKADHIYVLPGAFGWDNVGSWLARRIIYEK